MSNKSDIYLKKLELFSSHPSLSGLIELRNNIINPHTWQNQPPCRRAKAKRGSCRGCVLRQLLNREMHQIYGDVCALLCFRDIEKAFSMPLHEIWDRHCGVIVLAITQFIAETNARHEGVKL